MIGPNARNAEEARRPYWVFALAGLGAEGALQVSHQTWLMQADLDANMLTTLAAIWTTQTLAGAVAALPLRATRLTSTLIYGALATVAHQAASFFAVLLMGAIMWLVVTTTNVAFTFQLRALVDSGIRVCFAMFYVPLLFFVWRRFAPDAQPARAIAP